MAVVPIARLARLSTLAACWVLLLSLVAVVLDIATAEPGRWSLIPHWAEMPILLAPLVVAVGALLSTVVAALRRESEAYRPRTWLASCLIVMFYGVVFACYPLNPLTVQ